MRNGLKEWNVEFYISVFLLMTKQLLKALIHYAADQLSAIIFYSRVSPALNRGLLEMGKQNFKIINK